MYVYFIPCGGLNDILYQITKIIKFCEKYKRTLLLDTTNSVYKINFHDYFTICNSDINIITNIHDITKIINKQHTIYPEQLPPNILQQLKYEALEYTPDGYKYKDIMLKLPTNNVKQDIIFHASCGGGDGFPLFSNLLLREDIKSNIKYKLSLLPEKYLCIHIRNTDYKCDYKALYNDNKTRIHAYETIYICTDDQNSLLYFNNLHHNVLNFTTFPEQPSRNLHYSNISPHIKIMDTITDIYIASKSNEIISCSKGGYIKLLRAGWKNKIHLKL
jgi:hypothetical protein